MRPGENEVKNKDGRWQFPCRRGLPHRELAGVRPLRYSGAYLPRPFCPAVALPGLALGNRAISAGTTVAT